MTVNDKQSKLDEMFLPYSTQPIPKEYKGFLEKLYEFDTILNENKKRNLLSLAPREEKFFNSMIERNDRLQDLLKEKNEFVVEIARGMVEWLIRNLLVFSFNLTDAPDDAVISFEMIMTTINAETKRLVKRLKESEDGYSQKMSKIIEKYATFLEGLTDDILSSR